MAVEPTNLVINPGFELGIEPSWERDAAVYTHTTEDKHSGLYAVKMVAPNGFSNLTTLNDSTGLALQTNRWYKFTFWYKMALNSGNGVVYQLNVGAGQAFGDQLIDGELFGTASQWRQVVRYFNSRENAKVWIRLFNNNSDVVAYFDDFSITLLETTDNPNLVPNPGFEANISNWDFGTTFSLTQEVKYEGEASARIVASSGNFDNLNTNNDSLGIQVDKQTLYEYSFRYKLDLTSGFGIQTEINRSSAFGTPLVETDNLGDTDGAWVKITLYFFTGNFDKIWVRFFNNNSVLTAYIDDLSITRVAAPIVGPIPKHYFYRVYTSGVLVATWTKEVISEPRFRSVINGGPGQLLVELSRPFDDFGEEDDVRLNNRVDCYVVDGDSPNGQLLYSGYISGYQPIIDGVTEKVEVTVLGFVAELERHILRGSLGPNGATTVAYLSADPSNIMKDVIDKYRAQGGQLRYSSSTILLTNTVVSYTFNTNTIKECFDKIVELCPVGWYFRVDPDGFVYLQPKNILADHSFVLGKHIEKLRTFRRIEDLINRVLFTGAGDPALFRVYENTGSQGTYGMYERKVVDQRVSLAATASIISNRLIDSQKDPEIRSTFLIIDNNGPGPRGYDIESIKPGQTLRVKNLKTGVASTSLWDVAQWDVDVWDQTLATQAADIIQIMAVEYTPDALTIEASSRLPQIAKRIEDVRRNLEGSQTTANPSAPT